MNALTPLAIEEVNASWLTQVIAAQYPGVVVERVVMAEAVWGTATKLRVAVDYNAAGKLASLPSSLIVKGGFAAHRQRMSYLYAHEVRFYRDLQGNLGVNTPRCLAAVDDFVSSQHIVLLEDLNVAGATFCRVETPLDFAQTQGFLNVLARLHATYWNSKLFETGGKLADLRPWEALPDGDLGEYAQGQLVQETWAHYMRLPRCLAVSKTFHDLERMRAVLELLNEFGRQEPHCLLHADFHLGNLYFDGDSQPGVLDWQSYTRGHWSHDVTYFMVSALDMADRRKWEEPLMRFYLSRLQDYGVASPPSFEAAMAAFRIQIADGLFYWMVNPPEWQSEENNCAVAPRFALAALDHRTFDLV